MDCEFPGLNLWLLRGIRKRSAELDVIDTLRQLGVSKPDFWYMPRIRKPELQNRGYAFLGYECAGDREAEHIIRRFATCDCPWPLELERSTATIENMENKARIWLERFVSPGISDAGGMQHQASWPRQAEWWQPKMLKAEQQKIRQRDTKNTLYANLLPVEDWQSLIPERQSMHGKNAMPNNRAYRYTAESDEFDCYDHGCCRTTLFLDVASTEVMGVPVFFF